MKKLIKYLLLPLMFILLGTGLTGCEKEDLLGLRFNDVTVTYDGDVHSISIDGNIPDGINVTYLNNDQTEAGVYNVIASFEDTTGKYKKIRPLEATLTIKKADFNMSDVRFVDQSFVYDGSEKELKIFGRLPDGVSVSYENNKLTDVGAKIATANFHHDNPNYNEIESMYATLSVTSSNVNLEHINFPSKEVKYDGKPHSLIIEEDLPTGIDVVYYNNIHTEAGVYKVEATFIDTVGNFDISVTKEATLTILKADYDLRNITFEDATYVYDGNEKELLINGTLPDGVTPHYSNNTLIDAGEVEATVSFEVSNKNYNEIPNMSAILKINKATYDLKNIEFLDETYVYDGREKELKIKGELPFDIEVNYIDNKLVDVGEIIATAQFINYSNNYNDIPDMSAKLTITKAKYNLDKISFDDQEFTYNGEEQEILISGRLPRDVTVTYENNKLTNAGSIDAIAHFKHANPNYFAIPDMSATLTINKAKLDISNLAFNPGEFNYDGKEHSIKVLGYLPKGVTITYKNNNQTEAGTYTVIASFTDESGNYSTKETIESTLTINKINYDLSGISFTDSFYIYDGKEHTILISGTLPEGLEVVYENNSLREIGSILATAKFINSNSNYNDVSEMKATISITEEYKVIYVNGTNVLYEDTAYYMQPYTLQSHGGYSEWSTEDKDFSSYETFTFNYRKDLVVYNRYDGLTFNNFDFELNENDNTLSLVYCKDYNYYQRIPPYVLYDGKILKVTKINENAFRDYRGSYLYIPNTIKVIEKNAIYNESSGSFGYLYYNGSLKEWLDIDIYSCIGSGTSFYYKEYDSYQNINDLNIPEGITTIKPYAFAGFNNINNANLTGVTNLGHHVFANTNINRVVFDEETKVIPDGFLYRCYNINDITLPTKLETIGEDAFKECNINIDIILPSNVTYIGDYAFSNNEFTNFELSQVVEYLGKGCFAYCNNLQSINIPASLTEIKDSTFNCCYSLSSINIDEISLNLTSIGRHAFSYTPIKNLVLPESITYIGAGAFYYMSSLESIILPSKLTSINNELFYGCSNLMNVTMPETLEVIGDKAFYDCQKLNNLNLGPSLTHIGDAAFYDCYNFVNEIIIPSAVTYIGDEVFYNCNQITNITFDVSSVLEHIGSRAFANLNLVQSMTLPESVLYVGDSAFYNCSNMMSLSIPKNAVYGSYVIDYCYNITTLNIPYISNNLSNNSINVRNLTISNQEIIDRNSSSNILENVETFTTLNTKKISNIFNNRNVSTVNLNEGLEEIGVETFYNCKNLTSITIPSTVLTIGDRAFNYSNLTEIDLPEGLETIGSYAFENCDNLVKITLPKSLSFVDTYAFAWNSSIKKIYYNGDMDSWAQITFKNEYSTPLYTQSDELYIMNSDGSSNLVTDIKCNSSTIKAFTFARFNSYDLYLENSSLTIEDNAFYNSDFANIYYKGTINDWSNLDFASSNANPNTYSSTTWFYNPISEQYIQPDVLKIDSESVKPYVYENMYFNRIEISHNVLNIGEGAFESTNYSEIYYDGNLSELLSRITYADYYSNPFNYNVYYKDDMNQYVRLNYELYVPIEITTINDYSIPSMVDYIHFHKEIKTFSENAFYNKNFSYVYYDLTMDEYMDLVFVSEYANPCSSSYLYLLDEGRQSYQLNELTSIGSKTSIGNYQFKGANINSISPDLNCYSFGEGAFYRTDISEFTIKDSPYQYGKNVVSQCDSLRYISIEKETLPAGILNQCWSVTDCFISSSVKAFEYDSIPFDYNVNHYYYDGTLEDWNLVSKPNSYMIDESKILFKGEWHFDDFNHAIPNA